MARTIKNCFLENERVCSCFCEWNECLSLKVKMKKYTPNLFQLLICFWFVCIQFNGYSQSQRFYEAGPLTQEDLNFTNQLDSNHKIQSFGLGYLLVKYKVHDSIFFVPRAISYFDPIIQISNNFLVNSLNYNQVIFNWYEIEARKLQKEFIEQDFSSNSKELLKASIDSIQTQIAAFENASKQGKDTVVVNNVLEQTNKILDESELYFLPKYRKTNFSGGLYLVYSQGFTTKNLKPIISTLYGVEMGLNLNFKKFGLLTSITSMSTKVHKSEPSNINLSTEGVVGGELSFGVFAISYQLLNTKNHGIYPFFGLAFSDLSLGEDEIEFSTRSIAYGFNYNYKFKKRVDYSPNKLREYQDFYLFANFLMNQINHYTIKGSAYSFSVGIGYNIGFLKIR